MPRSHFRKETMILSPEEDAFCNAIARGLNIMDAMKEAGLVDKHTKSHGWGTRHLRKPHIAARVAELRAVIEASRDRVLKTMADVTRENVLVDLLNTREDAKRTGNLVARTRCNELIGKEIGMFVTRVEGTMVHALDGVSSDVIRAALDVLARGNVTVIDGTTIEVMEDDVPGDPDPVPFGPTPVPELTHEVDPLS